MQSVLSPRTRRSSPARWRRTCTRASPSLCGTASTAGSTTTWPSPGPWGFAPADVRVPVFLWQGEQDLMVPPEHGRWLAARLPDCRARLLPDDGHLTLLVSRPGEVMADLASALRDHGSAAADAPPPRLLARALPGTAGLPRVVWLVVVGRAVNQLGAFTLPFLTVALTARFGVSVAVAGALMAVFGAATIASRLAGGGWRTGSAGGPRSSSGLTLSPRPARACRRADPGGRSGRRRGPRPGVRGLRAAGRRR